jgi:hypothetical protein
MAFKRDVPALDKLVLKYISKSARLADAIVNHDTIERMHRISKPSKSRTHKTKQELIRALLTSGRLNDDSLPDNFFHVSMTRLEMIGAKISTKFVTRVRWGNAPFRMESSARANGGLLLDVGDLHQAPHSQLLGLLPAHRRRDRSAAQELSWCAADG